MLPILEVGPLSLQTPGLILLVGLWFGLTLAEKHTHRQEIAPADIYNLVFTALIAGVIGARLAYVGRFPSIFASNWISIFSLSPALLDLTGGLAAGILASAIYAQKKGLKLWPTLDAVTPILGVMNIALGGAHLAAGDAFGTPTSLPWGIQLWGASRHPTQIYEIVLSSLVLLTLWPGRGFLWQFFAKLGNGEKPSSPPFGTVFLTFVALSAASRLFIEGFRGDSELWLSGFRAAQIIAWLVLGGSMVALRTRVRSIQIKNKTMV